MTTENTKPACPTRCWPAPRSGADERQRDRSIGAALRRALMRPTNRTSACGRRRKSSAPSGRSPTIALPTTPVTIPASTATHRAFDDVTSATSDEVRPCAVCAGSGQCIRAVGRKRVRAQSRRHIVHRVAHAELDQFGDDREHDRKAEHDARVFADRRKCAIENLADTERPQRHDARLVFGLIAAVLPVLGLRVLPVLGCAVLRRPYCGWPYCGWPYWACGVLRCRVLGCAVLRRCARAAGPSLAAAVAAGGLRRWRGRSGEVLAGVALGSWRGGRWLTPARRPGWLRPGYPVIASPRHRRGMPSSSCHGVASHGARFVRGARPTLHPTARLTSQYPPVVGPRPPGSA